MHGGSTSEVEAAHLGDPAGGVPSPAGDGVVDQRRPDKHEDHAGQHAATFGDGADSESDPRDSVSAATSAPRPEIGHT